MPQSFGRRAAVVLFLTLLAAAPSRAQTTRPAKALFIPDKVWKVPNGNDYSDPASEYCYRRSAVSDDLAMFWAKEYGDDPAANPDPAKRFDPQRALAECERFYRAYTDELKFVIRGHSKADRYKLLIYVFGGDDGTAYGGGEADKVGVLWTPAVRMSRPPYGALAHEIGHSFQYLVKADGNAGFAGGPIYEMTSQYMLWQVYPDWVDFEKYHVLAYLNQTHLAFLHPGNQYHSPFVLEYWQFLHGPAFVGSLWRNAKVGEDPVQAYRRVTRIDQATFDDQMFDAARRFVTWDLPRVAKPAARFANRHTTLLRDAGGGRFEPDPSDCPQDYGYNAIKLVVPVAGTKLKLTFEGAPDAKGFHVTRPKSAGWRYGFLASKDDGTRVYGPACSAAGTTDFVVPDGTKFLWLVVMGAPTDHVPLADEQRTPGQWPYRFALSGTTIDPACLR